MKEESTGQQVRDDSELLELMMQDITSASNFFKPTNFWTNYEKIFLPEIRALGLKDFRRRKNSVLSSFGATDLSSLSLATPIPLLKFAQKPFKFFLKMSLKVRKMKTLLNHNPVKYAGIGNRDINLFCYEFAKSYGEKNGAKPIHEFEASHIGNPENVFYINGKMYTNSLLNYYVNYAYCCKFMNFDSIHTIMEIGCGSGKQVEIIKKLHPHITFYLFDIPPQLYVAEQYLSALFSDSVVSYRKTRTMKSIPEKQKGKIFIFANWKIPELANLNYDLFWNSASFQEMEPHVVLNYLKYVNQQTVKYATLTELMTGMKKTNAEGQQGVLEKTKLQHYKKGLKDFQMQDLSKTITLPPLFRLTKPSFSFWKRK